MRTSLDHNIITMRALKDCTSVERDPDKVSGAWIFKGTRVPVEALFENLRDGATVDEFLSWFPGGKRERVEEILDAVESEDGNFLDVTMVRAIEEGQQGEMVSREEVFAVLKGADSDGQSS